MRKCSEMYVIHVMQSNLEATSDDNKNNWQNCCLTNIQKTDRKFLTVSELNNVFQECTVLVSLEPFTAVISRLHFETLYGEFFHSLWTAYCSLACDAMQYFRVLCYTLFAGSRSKEQACCMSKDNSLPFSSSSLHINKF